MALKGTFLSKDIYYFEDQIIVISKMISGLFYKGAAAYEAKHFSSILMLYVV